LLSEAMHHPGVVFVAERAKHSFPERLFPARLTRSGLKLNRFGPKPKIRGLPEEIDSLRFGQRPQGGTTLAAQICRKACGGVRVQPETEFTERGIEFVFDKDCWRCRVIHGRFVPNHMQNDVSERRIPMVSVCPPAAGLQVNFNVARPGIGSAELHDSIAKIGATFAIEKTWMQYADGFAVERPEGIAMDALVLPHRLQQSFGWRVVVLMQARHDSALEPPLRVGVVNPRKHPDSI